MKTHETGRLERIAMLIDRDAGPDIRELLAALDAKGLGDSEMGKRAQVLKATLSFLRETAVYGLRGRGRPAPATEEPATDEGEGLRLLDSGGSVVWRGVRYFHDALLPHGRGETVWVRKHPDGGLLVFDPAEREHPLGLATPFEPIIFVGTEREVEAS